MLKLEYTSYTLDFRFQAKTSRGSMNDRKVWFLKVSDENGNYGIGEVAPIERLSPESPVDIPEELDRVMSNIVDVSKPGSQTEVWEIANELAPKGFSSIRFGLEVALFDLLHGGSKMIFAQDLHKVRIPINGLVWMGDADFMEEQIKEKLNQGYNCIKLKVGNLDFETEIGIIKNLRKLSDDLVIRLDANGAFATNEVLMKLKKLSSYNIHSIEQPILPMQPEAMEIVCAKSEIPIALDEELIWVTEESERLQLLQDLKPQYVVLKPTLHGGFSSIKNWIDLAEIQGVGWWITSYLESNIGLNAIAQFASLYENIEFHGLGTGNLFHNNIVSPIQIEDGFFKYAKSSTWGDVGL
ncbi:MAG: o-succinylbenzoate synthase [Cyclobacteriaceae bacterium]